MPRKSAPARFILSLIITLAAAAAAIHPLLPGLCGCSVLALAFETGFQGRVVDICSQEPIAGAIVSIKFLGRSTVTDSEGKYQLSAPPNSFPPSSRAYVTHGTQRAYGTYRTYGTFKTYYEVFVQASGYTEMSDTLQRVSKGNVTQLDFEMIPQNPTPEQRRIIDARLMVPQQPPAKAELDEWSRSRGFGLPSRQKEYLPSTIRVLMPDGHVELMDMEEYLKGVVPMEMPAFWSEQALRAQAVAARCYAATQHRHLDKGADVCTTTHCQCWSSRHYRETDQAVIDTQRVVATCDGSVIEAYYFAHCDGHTRNVEDVWTSYLPYCRSVWCACGSSSLCGHGVGMCQSGAQEMARQDSDYRQILSHYYTGITVQYIPPDLPSARFSTGDCVEVMPGYSGLELRAGPGEESPLITTLLEGSKGEVVENENNGQSVHGDYWWYVRFGNSIGWSQESGLERCDSPSFGITIGEEGKWQLGCFISSLRDLLARERATDFGRNPFEKGFLPSHFPKTFKSFGKGVQGEIPFPKGFPP